MIRMYVRWLSLGVILALGVWAMWPPPAEEKPQNGKEPAPKRDAKYKIKFSPGVSYMPGSIPYGIGTPLKGLKEVVDEFETRFPDTEVEIITVPGLREYLVTQLSSGNAPDILNVNVEDVWTDVQKGWYVPLDPYLEAPNPFIVEKGDPNAPGSKQWWDQFRYQAISRGKAAPDNLNYCLSLDMVETGIFYNKEAFRKAGISEPRDFEDWMIGMAKLEEAGYTPILMSIDWFNDWCTDLFFDQLYNNLLPGVDLVKDPTREAYLQGYLDWDELCFLYQKDFFTTKDPRYLEVWKIMKRFRKYCNKNLSSTDFVREFVTGKAAQIWNTSSLIYRLNADQKLGFEWGVFYLPQFTKQTSQYASNVPMCVIGGSATQLEVTNGAVVDTDPALPMNERIRTSERLKRVISLLQFLCVPENYTRIVNEFPCFVSNINGVSARPEMKDFETILERPYTTTKWVFTFDLKFSEIQRRMLELYLNNGIELDEFMAWQTENLTASTENLLDRKLDVKEHMNDLQKTYDGLAPIRATYKDLPPNGY